MDSLITATTGVLAARALAAGDRSRSGQRCPGSPPSESDFIAILFRRNHEGWHPTSIAKLAGRFRIVRFRSDLDHR